MHRFLLRLVILFVLALSPFVIFSQQSYICSQIENSDAVELTERLFAVHATSTLPSTGVLVAGLGYKEHFMGELPVELFPDFRTTVHFALGELVRTVEGIISWEECAYAVVTPLKDLMPQALNINCYDTFILGDFAFTPATTLVLPVYCAGIVDEHADWRLYFYDPSSTTLREAVDDVIALNGGWAVRMIETDEEDEFNIACCGGVNINTPEFLAPLKDLHPQISIGLRYEPFDGEAYLFGELENMVYSLAWHYLPLEAADGSDDEDCSPWGELTAEALLDIRCGLIGRSLYLQDFVYTGRFPWASVKCFDAKVQNISTWLNIIDADIQLRRLYGKTLMQAPAAIWEYVEQLKASIAELMYFLEGNYQHLPKTREATSF